MSLILPPDFYLRDVVTVARDLLGMRLVRLLGEVRLSGVIIEAEAYRGEEDLACHARSGRTRRTGVMYGRSGSAYVYFTYGMHWMLNCVCMQEDYPAAVLIRAVQPIEGLEVIASRRSGRPPAEWCSGPARLTRAFGIDSHQNGLDLCDTVGGLWIEQGEVLPYMEIVSGPRVGLGSTPEPWLSIPWRFRLIAPRGEPVE